MSAPAIKRLLTVGEIHRRTGIALHKIEYIIRSRGVEPIGSTGNARVFSEDVVNRILTAAGRDVAQTGGAA
jgi:hypothetical protein